MEKTRSSEWVKHLLSLATLVFLFGLCGRTLRFWDRSGLVLVSGGRELAYVTGALLIVAALLMVKDRKLPSTWTSPAVFLWGLVFLYMSDWLTRPYNFLQGPEIRGEIILGALAAWAVCRYRAWWLIGVFAALTMVALTWCFFNEGQGALLFSDDHTMFLFRLALLRDNFPSIPFWSPLWNGGFDARDFFATGALNVFFLSWPLLYTLPIDIAYNIIVVAFLFFLVPCATWLAASLTDLTWRGRALASILSVAANLYWYRWGLKYGTMGFVTSSALAPIVVTLGSQLLYDELSMSLRRRILFVIVTSLMLLWTPAGAVILPFIGLFLLRFRLPSRGQLFVLAALLVINIPWSVMLWRVSKVSTFLAAETKTTQREITSLPEGVEQTSESAQETNPSNTFRHKAGGFDKDVAQDKLQEAAPPTNPVIFILAIPAIALLRSRHRLVFGAVALWLIFLGTFGVAYKPQLELDRMIVLLALLLAVPVAKLLDEYVIPAATRPATALPASLALGMVVVSPFSAANILSNRSIEHYTFADESVRGLSDAIKKNSHGGRALFSGCVLHQWSGGHLGPLVYFSETPSVASSFAHNIWKYRQVFPASFISRGDQGIREYLDLMNATLVTAHESFWINYFRSRKDEFRELWHGGRFYLFDRVGYTSNYFHNGSGKVLEQNSRSVTVELSTNDVITKFVYFDFVEAKGCKVEPFEAAPDLTLIALRGCPIGVPVTIQAKPSWTRLIH